MNKENIINKIKGLLKKAKGNTTYAEAATATAKAYELMVKYSVSETELTDTVYLGEDLRQPDFDIYLGKRNAPEMMYLSYLLDRHFNVKCLVRYDRDIEGSRLQVLEIYGLPHHVEIANHLYMYLKQCYKSLFAAWREEEIGGTGQHLKKMEPKRNSYYQGLTYHLDILLDTSAQEYGIVPVTPGLDKVSEKADTIPTKKKEDDLNAFAKGYEDAEKVSFHTAIKESDGRAQLITA